MDKDKLLAKYLPKMIGFGLNVLAVPAPRKAASIALDIFRTPRNGRIRSNQKKFLKKFNQQTIKADGLDIMTYDNEKSGKTVLLCHGWESNSSRWRKVYRELKDTDLRIVMIDAPAHGGSGSDKFDALIYSNMIHAAATHFEPEIILGHSVGGYSTLFCASTCNLPSVKKLVILASPDKLTDISERYFNMLGYSNRLRNRYAKLIEEVFGEKPEKYSVAEYSRNLQIPGLIIHDAEDNINLYYEGEAIHEAWSQSKLITTNGLGHSLQGQEVFAHIKDYLQEN